MNISQLVEKICRKLKPVCTAIVKKRMFFLPNLLQKIKEIIIETVFMEQGCLKEHKGTQILNLKRCSLEQTEVSLILKILFLIFIHTKKKKKKSTVSKMQEINQEEKLIAATSEGD